MAARERSYSSPPLRAPEAGRFRSLEACPGTGAEDSSSAKKPPWSGSLRGPPLQIHQHPSARLKRPRQWRRGVLQ